MGFVKSNNMFCIFSHKCSPGTSRFAFFNFLISKMIKNFYQFIIGKIPWS